MELKNLWPNIIPPRKLYNSRDGKSQYDDINDANPDVEICNYGARRAHPCYFDKVECAIIETMFYAGWLTPNIGDVTGPMVIEIGNLDKTTSYTLLSAKPSTGGLTTMTVDDGADYVWTNVAEVDEAKKIIKTAIGMPHPHSAGEVKGWVKIAVNGGTQAAKPCRVELK